LNDAQREVQKTDAAAPGLVTFLFTQIVTDAFGEPLHWSPNPGIKENDTAITLKAA
jgi:hypothetical protein